MGYHNGRFLLDWIRYLLPTLLHRGICLHGALQMNMIKRLLTLPTPLEMAAKELVEAQRSKLEAESAQDYAEYMVAYNNQRIDRLRERVLELRGEQT